MSLVDIFSNLKTSIMGTKSADIDRSIDKSLSMISKYSSSTSRNNYIELLKNMFSNSL